jgi:putative ABC transport system permease protein
MMDATAGRFYQRYPHFYEAGGEWKVTLVPLHRQLTANVRLPLLVLMGAVGFVLLVACANVANLLLARGATREREMAVRLALGAGRARVVQQLLVESLLLALTGAAAGLLTASWGLDLLLALIPADLLHLGEIAVDAHVLAFTLGVSLLVGVLFGLAPAVHSARTDLSDALRVGRRSVTASSAGRRTRSLLVVCEVGLALVLAVGAGLLIQSFFHLTQVDPGFNPENVLTLRLSPSRSKYAEAHQVAFFYQQAVERIAVLPGVASAGGISALPLSRQGNRAAFTVEGEVPPGVADTDVHYRLVAGDYIQAMGIPLLQGRPLSDSDNQKAPMVAVINQTMARRLWPQQTPLGRRISFGGPDGPWYTVVGVVGDVKHMGLEAETEKEVYLTYAQAGGFRTRAINLVARGTSDPTSMAAAIRSQIRSIDPDQAVYDVRTMNQVVSGSISQPLFNVVLLGVFAFLALALATVGIYGVISHSVSQRTHEIGVRIALGAQRRDVLRLVVGQGLALTLIGLALGIAAALLLTRFLDSLLFVVGATDPATFAGMAVLLVAVALLACYLPARRATRVEPMEALRYE